VESQTGSRDTIVVLDERFEELFSTMSRYSIAGVGDFKDDLFLLSSKRQFDNDWTVF